jgi:catechol 2,3-dioxygenase-like lactoylglutathione lyase family enzyme
MIHLRADWWAAAGYTRNPPDHHIRSRRRDTLGAVTSGDTPTTRAKERAMLADGQLMAFVSTTDLDRARAFYADILGLSLADQTPFACVFDVGGTILRVTRADSVEPAPHTVLGWIVDDIAREVLALTDRDVTFHRYDGMDQDAAGVWTTPGGDRIAWFSDTDGNVLSLTQFAHGERADHG